MQALSLSAAEGGQRDRAWGPNIHKVGSDCLLCAVAWLWRTHCAPLFRGTRQLFELFVGTYQIMLRKGFTDLYDNGSKHIDHGNSWADTSIVAGCMFFANSTVLLHHSMIPCSH